MEPINIFPTVSVSMITYGHEVYIKQAIESILMQDTDFEYELIIANDCSPDNTDSIVKEIISSHPKGHIIKYYNHAKNLGMQPNGAFAISKCTGKYIAACEGDDYWTDPLKLQKQVNYMESNPNLSFTFHGAQGLTKDGILFEYYRHARFYDKTVVNIKDFLKKGAASYSSASLMLKTEVVKNIPDWFINASVGDYPLIFMALEYGDIGYLADVMCVYRVNSINSWSLTKKNFFKRVQSHLNMIYLNRAINKGTNGKYHSFLPRNIITYTIQKIKSVC